MAIWSNVQGLLLSHSEKRGWFLFFQALFEWASKSGQLYPAPVDDESWVAQITIEVPKDFSYDKYTHK